MKPPDTLVRRRALLRGLNRAGANPRPNTAPPAALLRAQRPAMGSYFEVALPANAPAALALAERALDRIEALEAQMTIYRDDSELAAINAHAHEQPIPVEPKLFGLLQRAIALSQATSGAYDVTSGALSLAWGFVRGPKRVPDPVTLAAARERSGFQRVTLDPARRTIHFQCPGIVLNLGSIGKGFALDEAAAIVREHWWPTPALLHGGHSSALAVGSPPDQFGGRWPIALRDPLSPARPLGTIHLRNRALGTSGNAFQTFTADGVEYGHILDPRTGSPAQVEALSVTVLAPTAADADALSTAFTLLGPREAIRYCQLHPKVGAIFVSRHPNDPARSILQLINLTSNDFTPTDPPTPPL